MNSDYDDLLTDLAALLAVLYVAFRAHGVPTEQMSLMLPIAAGMVGLYFAVNVMAGIWQGYNRERSAGR